MEPIPAITVHGSAREVGRAHAEGTLQSRDALLAIVESAKMRFPIEQVGGELARVVHSLQQHSPDTLEQVAGMSEVFGIDEQDLLHTVLPTYFLSRSRSLNRGEPAADEGCSTYAFSHEGGSVLVKNRDTSQQFLSLQTVLHVSSPDTYSWSALSTVGAPGVHSGGVNEHGLGVVDTHVPSSNSGPGVPRFSMMMHMLQHCRTVDGAETLHRSLPSMGYGNLVLLDARGDKLVIESGYQHSGYRKTRGDFLIATNHFVEEGMEATCLEPVDGFAGADTRMRKQRLEELVPEAGAQTLIDPLWPLQWHEEAGTGSVCVHSHKASETISSIVIRPTRASLGVALGKPCESVVHEYAPADV